jgi:RHS repeat-associated protein
MNGAVSVVAPGGPIALNAAAPGDLAAAGQVDDWTIYGRPGQSIVATVHTGAGGQPAPPAPVIGFAQVTVLDAVGHVLASANNVAAGADAAISPLVLPLDGTYRIRVQASPENTTGTGNYILTVDASPIHDSSLTLNQQVNSQFDTPISVDRWEFSAADGEQVQFHVVAASSKDIVFDLSGPGGFVGFTGLEADSAVLTLPISGAYTLTARLAGPQLGAYAFVMETTPIDLTPGTPITEPLAGSGQTQLYRLQLSSAGLLHIGLVDLQASDQNEVYVKLGAPPTRADYDFRSSAPASANQAVTVPQAAAGTWYILVYNALASASGSYTLKAAASALVVDRVSPPQLSTGQDALLTLTGAGFDATTVVELVAPGGTVFRADSVQSNSPTNLTATFVAGRVPSGTYTVRITKTDGSSSELADSFTMIQGGEAHLVTNLIAPSNVAIHLVPAVIEVEYSNTGTAAMPAPLLFLSATQGTNQAAFLTLDPTLVHSGIWNSAIPDGFFNSVQLLASGANPGWLQPGESIQVPVYWAGWLQSEWNSDLPIVFHLSAVHADDARPTDWNALNDSLRPSSIAPDAWNALYPNLVAQLGSTWGQYVTRMDADAAYLAGLGEKVTDLSKLFGSEILQANGLSPLGNLASATDASVAAPGLALSVDRVFSTSIIARNQVGPFGAGWWWSHGWQRTLSVQSDGTVVIADGDGTQRRFQPDQRGGYFDQPGDHATLTKLASGGYTVTETDGLVTSFDPAGQVDYVQDTNGNRITAGYTDGLLASLTDSSGQSLQIAYNGAGRIIRITDPASGRIATYTYDTSNQHLLTAADFDGLTATYTYDTGSNLATDNALLSATSPAGTHQYFTYDTQGRLADTRRDDGAQDVTYSYGPAGEVSATDADGGTTTYSFDANGLVAKVEDALQHVVLYSHDASFNLVQVIDPTGGLYKFAHDSSGNLIGTTDPLGHTETFGYAGPFNRLTSSTDQNGNTTRYGYDPLGNETSTTYTDGSVEQMTYDALGEPKTLTNRRGHAVKYQYDTSGRIAYATFADGTQMIYHYDAHGNLKSTTDPTGTTTLTYYPNNQLERITYPDGSFLQYSYDSGGRRTQMVDQTAFTVNYTYDAVGRLSMLTDGSGALIDRYTYDAAGRLKGEDKGNGTYTTYDYNLAGNVLHMVNHAPDGSVNSRFDYTYDDVGRVKTETTLDGVWTDTYDAIGALTDAGFASDNPSAIPNQDLQYFYDPAGNRTRTIINGTTTDYVTNNFNQNTSIGNETLIYDADGNLVSKAEGSQTSTYTFNDWNQLVALTAPGETFTAHYDALGFRVATSQGGQAARYVVDPAGLGNVVGSYDGSGNLVSHDVYGTGLVAQVDASGASDYYDFDALGSTAGLTGTSGRYRNQYTYDPFGQILSNSGPIVNPFQFVGQLGIMQDPTGLDFTRARFYSPTEGQFLSDDPLGFAGGSWVLHEYAGNDPVNRVDPSGMEPDGPSNPWTDLAQDLASHALLETAGAAAGAAGEEATSAAGAAAGAAGEAASGFCTVAMIDIHGFGMMFDQNSNSMTYGQCWPNCDNPPPMTIGPGPNDDGPGGGGGGGAPAPPGSIPGSGTGENAGTAGGTSTPGTTPPLFPPPAPPPPLPGSGPGGSSGPVSSFDPNDKIGPAGYGSQGFIAPGGTLPYRIDFENEATATSPAQRVVVTDQLDANFDWKTFALTGVGFGDTDLAIAPGSQHYQTAVDIAENSQPIEVDIELGLKPQAGLVTATFQTIDPRTDLPPDVLTGFLPPEDGTGRGKGYFTYLVQPKAGLPTGTQIRNVATVVFDDNAPITTDQVDPHDPTKGIDPAKQDLITIDAGPPTSTVGPLPPTETSASFAVNWSGHDDAGGSGVASYNIYVSDNGGPFTIWQSDSTENSANFTGQPGRTYAFYSVATDNVGNAQSAPTTAQATTTVLLLPPPSQPAPPVLMPADDSGIKGDNVTDNKSPAFSGTTQAGATVELLNGTVVVGTATANSSGDYVVSLQNLLAIGTYRLTAVASNSGGSSPASNPLALTIVAPAPTPNVPTLLPADRNGNVGETTDLSSPYLTGTAIAGTTVEVLNAGGKVLNTTKANSAGTYQIQIPGPLAPGSYSLSVDIVDQYGDVSSPSPAQTITVVNPPAPTVQKTTVTIKRGSIQSITVYFTEPMTKSASNAKNYTLVDAGSSHIFGGKGNTNVTMKSVTYSSIGDSVQIKLAKPVRTSDSLRLTIKAQPPTGLRGTNGQFLNETPSGRPGASTVVYLGAPGTQPPPPKPATHPMPPIKTKKGVTKAVAGHFAPAREMELERASATERSIALSRAATLWNAAMRALWERAEFHRRERQVRAESTRVEGEADDC